MSQGCITQRGLMGCYTFMISGARPPSQPPPAPSVAAAPDMRQAAAATPAGDGVSVLVPVLVSVLGGTP